jgi:hypothetical protein
MNACRSIPVRLAIGTVLALSALAILAAGSGAFSETKMKTVKMRDDCEPISFNAAVGPGTCVGDGRTTFAELVQELRQDQAVEAWRFNPATFDVVEGKVLFFENLGGETHTFTKVAAFGGGFVAGLNALSGNPVPRPECAIVHPDGSLAPQPESLANVFVEAGLTEIGPTAGSPILPAGEESKFMCCIHPWMRGVVRVPER